MNIADEAPLIIALIVVVSMAVGFALGFGLAWMAYRMPLGGVTREQETEALRGSIAALRRIRTGEPPR